MAAMGHHTEEIFPGLFTKCWKICFEKFKFSKG